MKIVEKVVMYKIDRRGGEGPGGGGLERVGGGGRVENSFSRTDPVYFS